MVLLKIYFLIVKKSSKEPQTTTLNFGTKLWPLRIYKAGTTRIPKTTNVHFVPWERIHNVVYIHPKDLRCGHKFSRPCVGSHLNLGFTIFCVLSHFYTKIKINVANVIFVQITTLPSAKLFEPFADMLCNTFSIAFLAKIFTNTFLLMIYIYPWYPFE